MNANDRLKNLSDIELVALTIYGEARGESVAGQIAVGCVIRNRFEHNNAKNYFEICLAPKQFSCWNMNDPNRAILSELAAQMFMGLTISNIYLTQCMFLAEGIVRDKLIDNVKGNMYYMETALFQKKLTDGHEDWSDHPTKAMVIGNHTFFTV